MPYPKHFVGQALWLYYRFNLSHRDIEDLLTERGIIVSMANSHFKLPLVFERVRDNASSTDSL